MTDSDTFPFIDVFKNLRKIFPTRLSDQEQTQMGLAYFKAMRRFTLGQATAGAEIWTQRGKFFPKPAEWINVIPREMHVSLAQQLSSVEVAEYLDAERRHYEGEPCRCEACRASGVDHRFLRFVPEFDEYDSERRALIGDRSVVRGHWAHGEELRRWYAAKEAFWAKFGAAAKKHSMDTKKKTRIPFEQRIAEIYAPRAPIEVREPGEEG